MSITRTVSESISSDTTVLSVGTTRPIKTILANTAILKTQSHTLSSTSVIGFRSSVNINSATKIVLISSHNILSNTKITVNHVDLKLFKQSDPFTEVGTLSNPIVFTSANAGETTLHPDNPFLLYNDKNGSFNSVDAKNVGFEVIEMSIVDELVGTSNGTANQVFTVAFPPVIQNDSKNPVRVFVGLTEWFEAQNFIGASNTDQIFVVNYTLGTITFGNNINGAIPINGSQILVTYSPDTTTYGVDAEDDGWLGVQSTDVDRHDRIILLEQASVPDLSHAQVSHIPLISVSGVQGVFLISDPNRLGTNYFTGGSYNATTGLITLGTSLPGGTTSVLVDYKYTITDDAEIAFTQLGEDIVHTFINPIPSKNAKKLNFETIIPANASPTNGVKVKFRLRVYYTEF